MLQPIAAPMANGTGVLQKSALESSPTKEGAVQGGCLPTLTTLPGTTLTWQPSEYTSFALPPGPAMSWSPALACAPVVTC